MNIQIESRVSSDTINEVLKLKNVELLTFLFVSYSGFEIPIGTVLNEILDSSGNLIYTGPMELQKVVMQTGKELESIPEGWKTICSFGIDEEGLKIINELPVSDAWGDSDDYIIFKK